MVNLQANLTIEYIVLENVDLGIHNTLFITLSIYVATS